MGGGCCQYIGKPDTKTKGLHQNDGDTDTCWLMLENGGAIVPTGNRYSHASVVNPEASRDDGGRRLPAMRDDNSDDIADMDDDADDDVVSDDTRLVMMI